MALHVPNAPGFSSMMKEGSSHYRGLDEAVYRNIEACRQLAKTTKSAYGPNGMNKMVINHLEKLFVTNDAATIMKELEVEHPAAKMLVLASQMQESESGDGTNFVLIFAGALLHQAEYLLRMGLSPSEVLEGYEKACEKAMEILPTLVVYTLTDLKNVELVSKALKTTLASKQYGIEDFIAKLIADACVCVLSKAASFNVDSVRVCKILGSGVLQSTVVKGMVFKREIETDLTSADDVKIVVFSCPFESMNTETKGTVLINTADELMKFSKGEEDLFNNQVQAIIATGATVVVTGGKVSDLALHYCNKYKILVVRLQSKFDLRRVAKTVGATVLSKLTPPTADELGHCDHVYMDEIGDTNVVIFKQDKDDSKISTVVVRGSTDSIMDDVERAIDDGINAFKVLTKDGRYVPGAGATEIELAKQLQTFSGTCPGLDQYAIKKFADAFEDFPRTMSDNAGVNSTEILSKLYAAHQEGKKNYGIDIEAEGAAVKDVLEAGILDQYLVKYWAIKLATNAAVTVLRVDQIIMARRAGGPKARDPQAGDAADDD